MIIETNGRRMPSLRTKALFHFDSDFSDAMGGNWTLHTYGGYPLINTSGGKFNGYYQTQIATRGKENYLEYTGDDSFFDLTEGDFTIDCWIKSIVSTIYLYNTVSVLFCVIDSKLSCSINGSSNEISSDIDTTNWTHVALVHKATSYYLFINGIKAAEKVMPMPNDATKHELCWCYSQNWEMRKLSVDEFRIVEGAAWTSDFVPSNSPYS
jgi:hypothetical protein